MKKILNLLPLLVATLLSALLFSYSAFAFVGTEVENAPSGIKDTGEIPLKEPLFNTSLPIESALSNSSSSGGSVQVNASKGDAVGTIFEQFLSPYTQR